MAKIRKKNEANSSISPRLEIDANKVFTRSFILGIEFIDHSGLRSRNVHKAETLPRLGCMLSNEVITTMKSNQFQASLRYVFLPIMKPNAITLMTHSSVRTTMKKISDFSTLSE